MANSHIQVVAVGWLIATIYFIICRASPCRQLPSRQVTSATVHMQLYMSGRKC